MSAPLLLLAALAVSGLVVLLLRRHASRLPKDTASARSLHRGDVPRAGGLAILAGALAALAAAPPELPGRAVAWIAAVAAVAVVSFLDDVRGVSPAWRLAVHAGAALVIATQVVDAPAAALAVAIVVVWGANLFNFMDGSDGLAAAMAIVGFATYAIAAAHAGNAWVPYAIVAAATVPFFVANRPPASMFMGDVGAVTLGFVAAAAGVHGVVLGAWPPWFPPLVFLPFLSDATITLARRLARGERVWQAHRSHYYQRLNTLGAGHRGTLAVYAALMLACSALAIACLVLVPEAGPWALAAALAVHLSAFFAIDYHERHPNR